MYMYIFKVALCKNIADYIPNYCKARVTIFFLKRAINIIVNHIILCLEASILENLAILQESDIASIFMDVVMCSN